MGKGQLTTDSVLIPQQYKYCSLNSNVSSVGTCGETLIGLIYSPTHVYD